MGLILNGQAKPSKPLPNVVTSFNEVGYQKYGKHFLETWQRYWPASIRLTVYYEGESEAFDMNTHGVSWKPIEEVEHLQDFMKMLTFPIMQGVVGNTYDVWFDARHARKVFMEMHAMKTYGGKVFWIDADSETHTHVPEDFLDKCLTDDKLACYLGRDGWYFTESGFIGFNANHPMASRFYKNYINLFISGAFLTNGVSGRLGWTDCNGFDAIRLVVFKGHESEFVNLAEGLPPGTMHPFENCAPAQYMHHYKGNRKETRTLREGDIIAGH